MIEKRNVWLPVVLMIVSMVVFAITRWPELMPPNFSAAYALFFCAGVYFLHRLSWWVPLAIMLLSDLALNFFYYRPKGWSVFQWYQLMNYAAYAVIFWLGRKFQQRSSLVRLVFGGVAGGLLFFIMTNTAAWFFDPFDNPGYDHTFQSWLMALTTGVSAWPGTWEFFRNTLSSSGLFTALFVAAMKYSEHLESAAEKKAAEAADDAEEAEPEAEESKA